MAYPALSVPRRFICPLRMVGRFACLAALLLTVGATNAEDSAEREWVIDTSNGGLQLILNIDAHGADDELLVAGAIAFNCAPSPEGLIKAHMVLIADGWTVFTTANVEDASKWARALAQATGATATLRHNHGLAIIGRDVSVSNFHELWPVFLARCAAASQ